MSIERRLRILEASYPSIAIEEVRAALWKEWFQRWEEGLPVDRSLLKKMEACGATLAEVTSRRVLEGRDNFF